MDDFTNDITTTGRAVVDGTVNGALELVNDEDWFAVTLDAGQVYSFDLTTRENNNSPLVDPFLTGIFTSTGTFISGTEDDDSGGDLNSYTALTPEVDGTYFVGVTGYAGSTGLYNLSIATVMDDFPEDTSTTGVVAVGSPATGTNEFIYDSDWFAAQIAADTTYHIEVQRDGQVFGTSTQVFDAGGIAVLPQDQVRGADLSVMELRPQEAGTYYISVDSDYTRGPYTVSLTPMSDDFAADTTTTAQIEVNGSARARMDVFNDIDWFAVTLEADAAYRMITTTDEGTDSVGRVPTVFGLYDAQGALVEGETNAGFAGPNRSVTVDTDGTYFIAVASSGNVIGTYTLAINEIEVVQGSQSNDWLTLASGQLDRVDSITGGAGVDMVSFVGAAAAVHVDLTADTVVQGDVVLDMASIENATGSRFDDVFTGSDRSEILRGMNGNDLFYGSDNADVYDGGQGRDTLDYSAADYGVSVSLLRGRGSDGDAGGDRMRNIENVTGTNHDDFIWGDHGNNVIHGLHGDDTIAANGGDDYILAGFGTDVIIFAGNLADYTVVRDGIRTEVTDLVGNDGSDVIGHAEILRFADQDMILV